MMGVDSDTITGTCGELFWAVNPNTRTLAIWGEGAMPDYEWESAKTRAPWYELGCYWSEYFLFAQELFDILLIDEGVTGIGDYAFCNLQLTHVSLPDSLRTIGEKAFDACELESLTIQRNVTTIKTGAFARNKFDIFYVSSENQSFCERDGVLFSKDGKRLVAYPNRKPGREYIVPNSVKMIDAYAFSQHIYAGDDQYWESIVLPDGLMSIGNSAFHECRNRENIIFPKSLRIIGGNAFAYTNLLEIVIPNGVMELVDYALKNARVQRLALPVSLQAIGEMAIDGGILEEIWFSGRPPKVFQFVYGRNWEIIPVADDEETPFNVRTYFITVGTDKVPTLYYPRYLASAWAPNGETTWFGYPIEPYDELPAWAR